MSALKMVPILVQSSRSAAKLSRDVLSSRPPFFSNSAPLAATMASQTMGQIEHVQIVFAGSENE